MTTFPDPAELYPDVAAKGSLAAALQDVAEEQGLVLGDVVSDERQPLLYASVPSETPLREALIVSAGHVSRYWLTKGWGQGIWLVTGKSRTLPEVARAAQAWRNGVRLRDIRRLVPFVELTGLAEAAEQGPAYVVAVQWQTMRQEAEEANWSEYRALIEAAQAEPKLRQLYPYTSHWTLRFSTTTGYPFSPDPVCLHATRRGRYIVSQSWLGAVLAETTTAAEAVALAVSYLSADIGPAVAGTYKAQGTPHHP
ncbi:DUF6193 family natural product biosynthesis protein [Actinomadura sp. HBU206391]|uniref:DUF6193 family natural product biosynthesis protein n=1 Tax=Actinomadura sp. HBU206391 TaxID=2731692 RepID=UPI0016502F40|nr:DUF6193 family natural product biosynthesis protein [Actinomadura sp. HBU206391]MBC6461452.1 hypothetical protein [Actinomadura sp. HBU206391]